MKSNLLLSILLLFLISCNKNDEVSEKDSLSIYCCGTKNPQWLLDEMTELAKIDWSMVSSAVINPPFTTTMSIYSLETDSIDYIAIGFTIKKAVNVVFFYTCKGERIDLYYPNRERDLWKLYYNNKFKLIWETQLETEK